MPRRPRIDGFWRRLTVVGAVVLAGSTAWAHHGGTLRLGSEAAGPYLVSVWTDPSPPEVGSCQVMIAVMRPVTRAPILDVAVRVTAERAGGQPIATAGSRADDPLGIRYLATLHVPTPGAWRVTIRVAGVEGAGQLEFPLDVGPATPGLLPIVAGTALAGAALGWGITRLARRERRAVKEEV